MNSTYVTKTKAMPLSLLTSYSTTILAEQASYIEFENSFSKLKFLKQQSLEQDHYTQNGETFPSVTRTIINVN